jgi:HSP20 family molecular chaperone IbpA
MLFLRREAEKIVRELFPIDDPNERQRLATEQLPAGLHGASAVQLAADLRSVFPEGGERYVWEVEVPGVASGDLKVYVRGASVGVEGRKELPGPGPVRPAYQRAERSYGPFRRVFDWPGPADASQTSATLKDGVLSISVRRIADRRGRRPRAILVEVARDHD